MEIHLVKMLQQVASRNFLQLVKIEGVDHVGQGRRIQRMGINLGSIYMVPSVCFRKDKILC